MSNVYWPKIGYTPILYADLVSPLNVGTVIGTLHNISIADSSITEQYYSDTRIQGKIVTICKNGESDGYIDNARIRMILSIPTRDWSKTLITGFVSGIEESDSDGFTKRTYNVESTIWGLSNHLMHIYVNVKNGDSLKAFLTNLLKNETKFQYNLSNAKDSTFGDTKVYDVGTSLLNIIMEVNEKINRVDVDADGRLIFTPYADPKTISASKTIDYEDHLTLTMEEMTKSTNAFDRPGRTIVISRNGQQVISSHYDPPATDESSQQTRGWLMVKTAQYGGKKKEPTIQDLHNEATELWKNSQDKGIEYDVKTYFADYHAGEVINLIPRKRSSKKCLISSVDTSFGDFTQKLTCREL